MPQPHEIAVIRAAQWDVDATINRDPVCVKAAMSNAGIRKKLLGRQVRGKSRPRHDDPGCVHEYFLPGFAIGEGRQGTGTLPPVPVKLLIRGSAVSAIVRIARVVSLYK